MIEARQIAQALGGRAVLHRQINSDLGLLEAVSEGLPISAVDALVKRGLLSAGEVGRYIVPPRSLARRRKSRRLGADESERLLRLTRILAHARRAFGDQDKAGRWLRLENRALGGAMPIDLAASETGARLVEKALGRIEHGVFS